jgi:hypothetical protein
MYDRTDSDAQLERVLIVTAAGCVAGSCFVWFLAGAHKALTADTPGFILWTLCFSLPLSVLAWFSAAMPHQVSMWQRVLAAIFLGGGAGVAWAIFIALVGPWRFRMLPIFGIYCWGFGGVCGMLAAAVFRKRSGVQA